MTGLRRLVPFLAAAALATLAACASDEGSRAGDDPMRVQGSITVGPVTSSTGSPTRP